MSDNATTKPKNVDYFRVPRPLWRCVRRLLPLDKPRPQGGRPAADKRAVLNGIWYVLWTGCQWKAVKREWFGVCSSTLHQRFQEWQQSGVFEKVMRLMVRFYARRCGIQWLFQAIDSKSCPAPLGGEHTGKTPVDRSKRGSKIHVLVDQRGAPIIEACPIPGETQFPARRWCKYTNNWLAFIQFASAHILMDMTVYG